ncbi:hypothetical protein AAMO2058_001519900 [Amorphochlora amoebiformis]|uniref:Ribosomal protein S11 n=1 Tax=Amorphochlora amoebiformis TaxID=1561963 RepID=A0A7S0H5B1_9EUKA|eukprot:491451-Amorphochlora_amoeboformis.AAC.1
MRTIVRAIPVRLLPPNPPARPSFVVINGSKNTTRITCVHEGKVIAHTSTRRSKEYKGTERRTAQAIYSVALDFGRELTRSKTIRSSLFDLRIHGLQKNAVLGLLDSGFQFNSIREVKNPKFNGCRLRKPRRL